MTDEKKMNDPVRIGYMNGSAWIHDDKSTGADIVSYVYLGETYQTIRERIVGLAKHGVYLASYDPRKEEIVGKLWERFWKQYRFTFTVTDQGSVPEQNWFKFEYGFVSAVRQHFADLPEGTRLYSDSARKYIEQVESAKTVQEVPAKKYRTTKQKNLDKK